MESSGRDDPDTRTAFRSALINCVKQASHIDDPIAAENSLKPARAAVLGLSLEEYDDLDKKCEDKLSEVMPHVRKYDAVRHGNVILLKVGQWKVGICVPTDCNTLLRQNPNVKVYYDILTSEISFPERPSQLCRFSKLTDVLRFIASLRRV